MNLKKTFAWLAIYSIAMGYLESAVVIYMREIYYPQGFAFPLTLMSNTIAKTEILREAATVIMLFAVGFLAGNNNRNRFAWFLYCFAIWDIFYYIFLKMMINWPESLLTWDVLFLIPFMWSGPVIAPVICSISMIVLSWLILAHYDKIMSYKPWLFTGLILVGAVIIFISFISDFAAYVMNDHGFAGLFKYTANQYAFTHYVPARFNWYLFAAGEAFILIAFLVPFRKKIA
jgi:hypothetical protein